MYLEFYKLREFPFAINSDPRFFYEFPRLTKAMAHALYTVQSRRGIVLMTGEVGAGKTFLTNVLVAQLGLGCQTLLVKHPLETSKQLLRMVAKALGLSLPPGGDKLTVLEALELQLLKLNRRGRLVALIFDEGQDLGDDALEEIRLLWNMEHEGQRLVQIVLAGQPELREKLQDPRWLSLAQRVVFSCHLGPLSLNETCAYVLHRRRVAKDEGCRLKFTQNALASIHAASKGIPRVINVLCDNALLVGYARKKLVINSAMVAEALRATSSWEVPARRIPSSRLMMLTHDS